MEFVFNRETNSVLFYISVFSGHRNLFPIGKQTTFYFMLVHLVGIEFVFSGEIKGVLSYIVSKGRLGKE